MTNQIILRDNEKQQWLQFQEPKAVFTTTDLQEVLPILNDVEQLVKEHNWYAAGFISYEASAAFDSALTTHNKDDFPLIWFGLYEKPTVFTFDNKNKTPFPQFEWTPSISKKEYFAALEKVRDFIKIGDTYQVNFTMRQLAALYPAAPPPFSLFQNIAQSAPYGAFIDIADYSICSASPELFFKIKNGKIISSPMKGTAPRGRTNAEDETIKTQLFNSQKDRSENVMIVDMIRNDLSKIAEIGTVHTPRLFDIEKYPTVWQMTSTVEGQTTAELAEIMTALFPCASITGAPKASTMRIIAELENTPRRIYTGTIGFIEPNGDMQFNVAIRTALFDKKNKQVEYGTGGGITIKSETEKEYEESILKTKIIQQPISNQDFKLLETMLWSPKDGWFLLDNHLTRLANSAAYFDFKVDLEKIKKAFFRRIDKCKTSAQKVRLLLGKDGDFVIENYDIKINDLQTGTEVADTFNRIHSLNIKQVQLATQPVDSSDVFLFHKTTNRGVYERQLKQFPDAKDVILWNEKGEITESCFGNVVAFDGKDYWTPPVECGLLNGVFRQHLLKKGTIRERIILKEELEVMEEVFLINSVRKWERAQIFVGENVSLPYL